MRDAVQGPVRGPRLVDGSGHDLEAGTGRQYPVVAERPDREPGETLIGGGEQPPDERLPDLPGRTSDQNPLHTRHHPSMNTRPSPLGSLRPAGEA